MKNLIGVEDINKKKVAARRIQELATKELVKELIIREGVDVIEVEPHKEKNIRVSGPTIIIKVND